MTANKKQPENRAVRFVEKVDSAREAYILKPFFATGLLGQKTLQSAQLCELSELPTMSADASAEK